MNEAETIVGATIAKTGLLGLDACFPDSVTGMVVDPAKADPFFMNSPNSQN